jgi:alcohol dehydrogenase
VGRGESIADDALALGAHRYLDTERDDVDARLKAIGGIQALIVTVNHAPTVSAMLAGLAPQGKAVLLGVSKDPLEVAMGQFVAGERSLLGSITGTPFENEKALNFSVLTDVRPMIETMPLERANEAYQRMKSGDVKFRMVLRCGSQH